MCRIGQLLVVDSSYFRISTAFTTVCMPFCSADDSAFPISYARQRLYLFPHYFAQRMVADCSFFCLSMAFKVCAPFCSADDSALLILLLVNGFHCLDAVLLSGCQCIPISYARQWLSRFVCRFAQRMAADYSFFRLSTAFTTVSVPCFPAEGCSLPVVLLVNGFHGLRAILLRR